MSAPRGNPAPGVSAVFPHQSLHAGGAAAITAGFWKGKEAATRGQSCWEPTLLCTRPHPCWKAARWDLSGELGFSSWHTSPCKSCSPPCPATSLR